MSLIDSLKKDIHYIDGIQIQAAILGAEKGHPFMRDCMNYYHDKHFILPDGSLNNKIISPFIFANINTTTIAVITPPYMARPPSRMLMILLISSLYISQEKIT